MNLNPVGSNADIYLSEMKGDGSNLLTLGLLLSNKDRCFLLTEDDTAVSLVIEASYNHVKYNSIDSALSDYTREFTILCASKCRCLGDCVLI